jgi:hypothetical protein
MGQWEGILHWEDDKVPQLYKAKVHPLDED